MKSLSRGLLFLSLLKKASYGGNSGKSSLSGLSLGKESFRFASFIGFEKGVQSSCPSQKLHYVEKLYISKLERYKFICFFDYGCFLFFIAN